MTLHRHWLDLPNDIPGTKAKAPTPATPTKPAQPAAPAKSSFEERLFEVLAIQSERLAVLEKTNRTLLNTVAAMQQEIVALKYPDRTGTLDLTSLDGRQNPGVAVGTGGLGGFSRSAMDMIRQRAEDQRAAGENRAKMIYTSSSPMREVRISLEGAKGAVDVRNAV